MLPPYNRDLNAVVKGMTDILLPNGFDTTPCSMDGFEQLTRHFNATGRILVWDGGSDKTVFGEPAVNHAFRAWHDLMHITLNQPFTPEGERKVCDIQIQQAIIYMREIMEINDASRIKAVVDMLDIEVNGQVQFEKDNGFFPDDQRAFMDKQLRMKGYAL